MHKSAAVFVLKSLAFTIVFFIVSTIIAQLKEAYASRSSQALSSNDQQSLSYERQLAESAAQLAKSSEMQQRMQALLTTQEEQIKRYEGVLQQWEKQTGLRK